MPRAPHDIPAPLLRVVLAGGVGPVTFARLRDRLGSWDDIASASIASLAEVEGIGTARAVRLRAEMDGAAIDAERDAMASRGATLIVHGDEDYPALLAAIPDPPVALWVRGEIRPEDQAAIAIVGSRQCTAYGREQAARFAVALAQCGLTIMSGGARGIDGEAHRGALRAEGRTIVVCGHGLAHAYPPEHAEMFDRVAEGRGAVISEHPMGVAPRPELFPRRNRIISGLSVGVVVIEAGRGSGALITARMAAEDHGREVMALPGRVDSPASAGCLEAIRDGWAALVTSHADVLLQIDSAGHLLKGAFAQVVAADAPGEQPAVAMGEQNLTDSQRAIVAALRDAGRAMIPDDLVVATQLAPHMVMAELTVLQIRGLVARDDRGVRLRGRVGATPAGS
jgi:DNA processing protein